MGAPGWIGCWLRTCVGLGVWGIGWMTVWAGEEGRAGEQGGQEFVMGAVAHEQLRPLHASTDFIGARYLA